MSDTKPLLVLQYPYVLKKETLEKMEEFLDPLGAAIGAEVLILQDGVTSQYHQDMTPLVAALDRYTAQQAEHTGAVRQNTEILTGLLTMLLTEQDNDDADDEPAIGASMNSPRAR